MYVFSLVINSDRFEFIIVFQLLSVFVYFRKEMHFELTK